MIKKLLSLTLITCLIAGNSLNIFAQNSTIQNTTKEQINCIYSDESSSVIEINTKDDQTIYFAIDKSNILNEAASPTNNTYNKKMDNSIIEQDSIIEQEGMINKKLDDPSKYQYSNRVYFNFYNSKSDAIGAAKSLMSSPMILHGSYIEDYTSWAGHGYHIYLSARDASYITNLGWVASDTLAGALAYFGIITSGVAIVLGAMATVAVLTLYWGEQDDDGALQIWSPDSMRSVKVPMANIGLGTAKIGNNWYPLTAPKF
jgi:hypothetical protein